MIRAVDLFCGIGGLTHGLVRGGVEVVAGLDLDPQCRFAYEANNRAQFIQTDIRKLPGECVRVLLGTGTRTLLAGCAPCQPFSTYRRSAKSARPDEKWNLVADFGRLVQETQPDLVTMENVPQLRDHDVFSRFLSNLEGYNVWHDVVQVAACGIPQTRKRLVLLASKLGPIRMDTSSANRDSTTVRATISHLRSLEAGEFDSSDPMHAACSLSPLNLRRIRASRPGGTWRDWDPSLVATCHQGKSGETFPSVYGRMEWDAPAPTITTQCFGYGNGRFGHPEQDRAISLREAALLQTFPSDYRFLPEGAKPQFSVIGRLIGNAVPVRLGEVIAHSLRQHVAQAEGITPPGPPTATSPSDRNSSARP